MLILFIHNDGTGTDEAANYDVEVRVTLTLTELGTIARGRIEGHRRSDGWQTLVERIAKEIR